MNLRLIAAAAAALFLTAVSVPPADAQTTTQAPAKSEPKAPRAKKAKEPRKLSAQQQKMRDCAGKWNEHKKATGAKGRKAYNDFMRPCLRGGSPS